MEFEQTYLKKRGMTEDCCVIAWPTSQLIMEEDWFNKEAELINDDEGYTMFGGSAYIVPKERIYLTNK